MGLRTLVDQRRALSPDARGWTLLELVLVMALIVILAGIAAAQHRNAVTRSEQTVLKENLIRMRDSTDQSYADKNKSPADMLALVSNQYMREAPKDPFTDSNSTWQTVPTEIAPSNPSALVGIYDAKTGAEGTALDGTQYQIGESAYKALTASSNSSSRSGGSAPTTLSLTAPPRSTSKSVGVAFSRVTLLGNS
jgi:general secretion pathway protein G